MIIELECSECGEKLIFDYEESNKVIKVAPCECVSEIKLECRDNKIMIGED